MRTTEVAKSVRKPTNLSLDSALLKEAKSLGINVSRSAEAGIAEAVKLHRQNKWLNENAKALESSNAYVEANGLRSEEHTSELQSRPHLVCRLLLEKKK